MRTIRMALVAGSLVAGSVLCVATGAQTSGVAPSQREASPNQAAPTRVAPGTVIPVQLSKSIDAKKAKTGEEIKAKVTEDMKTQSGEVLIPKDTEILGHVTAAQARSKEEKESDLGIMFDRAVLKNGNDMSMPASIQAVIAPTNNTPSTAESGGGGAASSSSPGGYPAGRSSGMGTGMQPPANPAPGAEQAGNNQAGSTPDARPPITSSTQGVIGISDYRLSAAADANQGSVVSSEKSNVKLESGTLMLLRVNQ